MVTPCCSSINIVPDHLRNNWRIRVGFAWRESAKNVTNNYDSGSARGVIVDKKGGCFVHSLQEIRNNNTCHSIVHDDDMRFNLALEERRVLLYLQRSGPQDAEILADSLDLSLQKTRDAIQTLAEKDLVSTPDGTVAELTGSGESYNLMNDESLDETSVTMSRAMRKIVTCVLESPLQTSAIPVFCTNQGITIEECVKALEDLESRGYPVSDHIN
jgi:hypothetical protein